LQFQTSCDFYASEPGRKLRVLSQSSRQHQRLGNRTTDFSTLQLVLGRSHPLLFNPRFQSFKLLLGHALQSHRCGQIQSWNVFHFVAACCLATEFLYFWVSAHFQKHFIRIGDGQSLFNQAMLNQNTMIRRYCQGRWMGLRSALVLSWVFHCTMLTRFLNPVISLGVLEPDFPVSPTRVIIARLSPQCVHYVGLYFGGSSCVCPFASSSCEATKA
jgi:hypothetical protein